MDAELANRGVEQKQHMMILAELEVDTASLKRDTNGNTDRDALCDSSFSKCLKGLCGRIRHSPELFRSTGQSSKGYTSTSTFFNRWASTRVNIRYSEAEKFEKNGVLETARHYAASDGFADVSNLLLENMAAVEKHGFWGRRHRQSAIETKLLLEHTVIYSQCCEVKKDSQ